MSPARRPQCNPMGIYSNIPFYSMGLTTRKVWIGIAALDEYLLLWLVAAPQNLRKRIFPALLHEICLTGEWTFHMQHTNSPTELQPLWRRNAKNRGGKAMCWTSCAQIRHLHCFEWTKPPALHKWGASAGSLLLSGFRRCCGLWNCWLAPMGNITVLWNLRDVPPDRKPSTSSWPYWKKPIS